MPNTLNHISNTTTGQNYYASGTNQTDYAVGDLLTGTVLQGGEHPVPGSGAFKCTEGCTDRRSDLSPHYRK